jgi:hypothetical protein
MSSAVFSTGFFADSHEIAIHLLNIEKKQTATKQPTFCFG